MEWEAVEMTVNGGWVKCGYIVEVAGAGWSFTDEQKWWWLVVMVEVEEVEVT